MSTQLPNGWTGPDRPHVHVPHDRLGTVNPPDPVKGAIFGAAYTTFFGGIGLSLATGVALAAGPALVLAGIGAGVGGLLGSLVGKKAKK